MEGDSFTRKKLLCIFFSSDIVELFRCNVLSEIIYALKAFTVMDHQLAGKPHIEQRHGSFLPPTVALLFQAFTIEVTVP